MKNEITDLQSNEPIPLALTKWLSKLNLLYGVPFEYLVPDEIMLPKESIRFFHMDENWVNNLLDGALSIGRIISNDVKHDNAVGFKLRQETLKEVPRIRQRLLNKPLEDQPVNGLRTGFLLRSVIVEGWPGLEVKAYSDIKEDANILPILRMERLAKDVLMCIFDGEFHKLELTEPAETMHFGADLDNGKFTKLLRGLGVNHVGLGVEMPDVIVDVPIKDTDSRTLDVIKMVENMKAALQKKGELGQYLSSAEFAVEMIESAQMGVFENE
jgi:hypothetical protein